VSLVRVLPVLSAGEEHRRGTERDIWIGYPREPLTLVYKLSFQIREFWARSRHVATRLERFGDGKLSPGHQGSPGMSPKIAKMTQKSTPPSRTLGLRRQLLVGKTRSETVSSPDRIRTFHRPVNSPLLISGAVASRRADRAPEPNRFEPTTRQSTAWRSRYLGLVTWVL